MSLLGVHGSPSSLLDLLGHHPGERLWLLIQPGEGESLGPYLAFAGVTGKAFGSGRAVIVSQCSVMLACTFG